jgi:hypothetical protein
MTQGIPREPTDKMIEAGRDVYGLRNAWKAMYDAALLERPRDEAMPASMHWKNPAPDAAAAAVPSPSRTFMIGPAAQPAPLPGPTQESPWKTALQTARREAHNNDVIDFARIDQLFRAAMSAQTTGEGDCVNATYPPTTDSGAKSMSDESRNTIDHTISREERAARINAQGESDAMLNLLDGKTAPRDFNREQAFIAVSLAYILQLAVDGKDKALWLERAREILADYEASRAAETPAARERAREILADYTANRYEETTREADHE